MGFVASVISAVVDIVVSIVEAVVQIVEVVVQLIMVLLGYDGGSTQIIEYFEVRNYPLFDDVDKKNPIQQSILQAILSNQDLSSTLIYNLVFRSLKGNVKEFMDFIENGNYFEGFPELDSYIIIINYTELTAALQTLNGVPCTPEASALRALSQSDWIKYWLQENKGYDVGINQLGGGYATTSTSPGTPASDTVQITSSTNHFDVDITSESVTSDSFEADQRWQVNLSTVVYNATPDTYTVQIYNAAGITLTLPYTVPSKPTQLHYVSEYYRNSLPSRKYLFVYKVGEGTYPDLDTVEEPINIDNSVLQAIPAVPLRISNANYTTFGATKKQQIEDLLAILNLDAQEIIDGVMNDPGAAPGDIDNVYVNFGVRMWDTSQAGMGYLFNMFENLFPSQGTTQGTYNNTATGDTKPTNNIHTTTDDNNYAFQFNYITFTHTSLTDINANSGSPENGIYYSDMSKFGDDGLLKFPYYSSSGKGTYNVGYKADTLTEVANFLAGNGTTNPGTTTTEAANWLQVTERLSYNNPTPVLQESDGTTSTIIYLTPDAVYENNGSGVLRYVQQASEETTSGQSITYYCIKPSGLDAYTVAAPIAALRVVDGDTGKFKTVKFNLGAKGDLMVPFIHTFVKDLSHTEVAQLFLAGAHVSIYIAHYEVIVHAGMGFFEALVMIIIIAVIIYFTFTFDGGKTATTFFAKIVAAKTISAAIGIIFTKLATYAFKFVVQAIIQQIIVEIAGDNSELAMILNLLASVAIMSWEGNMTYGEAPVGELQPGSFSHTGGATIGMGGGSIEFTTVPKSFHFTAMTSFRSPLSFTGVELFQIANMALQGVGSIRSMATNTLIEELNADTAALGKEYAAQLKDFKEISDFVDVHSGVDTTRMLYSRIGVGGLRTKPDEFYAALITERHTLDKAIYMPNYDNYAWNAYA
jgi:hypothetical protein